MHESDGEFSVINRPFRQQTSDLFDIAHPPKVLLFSQIMGAGDKEKRMTLSLKEQRQKKGKENGKDLSWAKR